LKEKDLEAINQRISEYNNTILPILERLKAVNVKIHDINAEKPIDVVNKDIITTLGLGA
jgi:adenylate kinase family enzyme